MRNRAAMFLAALGDHISKRPRTRGRACERAPTRLYRLPCSMRCRKRGLGE